MSSRIIQGMQTLAERATAADRIQHMDADVREATALLERRLRDYALRTELVGYTADEDAEYAVVGRTVIGRLRMTRP